MYKEKENIVQIKSYNFSLRIVKLYYYLVERNKEYVIAKQILKSGTSIGANIEEAIGGFSKKDFIHKIQISYKEARETIYWLKLMKDSGLLEEDMAESLIKDCEEILKIITSILKTAKKNR